jgi:hypothetical protein
MRRLPKSREPEEKTYWSLLAPRAAGLIIGLLLGYLFLLSAPNEPEAAPAPTPPASASLR